MSARRRGSNFNFGVSMQHAGLPLVVVSRGSFGPVVLRSAWAFPRECGGRQRTQDTTGNAADVPAYTPWTSTRQPYTLCSNDANGAIGTPSSAGNARRGVTDCGSDFSICKKMAAALLAASCNLLSSTLFPLKDVKSLYRFS